MSRFSTSKRRKNDRRDASSEKPRPRKRKQRKPSHSVRD